MNDNKIKIGLILATVIVVIVGVIWMSSGGSSKNKIDMNVLIRKNSHQTDPVVTTSLVEFSDFQCPACITYYPLIKQLNETYQGKLNYVYRNYPLQQHKNAIPAAQAAEAAGLQGKYWEMFDLIFTDHTKWENESDSKPVFEKFAADLKLNLDKFKSDSSSDAVRKIIEDDFNDGSKVQLEQTPTFFVNGEKIDNPASLEDFRKIIDSALKNSSVTSVPVSSISSASFHAHANVKVILNGKALDFSQSKYQSTDSRELNPYIHFHDNIADVIHIHKQAITLGDLFTSLKMSLDSKCLTTDTGDRYCTDSLKTLSLYVNGNKNNLFDKYVPVDLDRILIIYGAEDQSTLKKEIDSVPDSACIYSGKCPQRGNPPSEECVGGLGTACK